MENLERYPSLRLEYRNGARAGKELSAYVDSDWGKEVETCKSISGQVAFFGMSPISYKSKKQQTIALSSAEAEYMAVSDLAK